MLNLLYSQTRLSFNQTDEDISLLNAAMVGFEDGVFTKISFRVNKDGFFGSSNAMLFQLNWTFKTTDNISYNLRSLKLHNHLEFYRHERPAEYARRKSDRHGIGLFFGKDKLGTSALSSTAIRYGRHLQISNKSIFSIGVSYGINLNQLNGQNFHLDPRVIETSTQEFIPLGLNSKINQTFDLGWMIYRKNGFLGHTIKNYIDNLDVQAAYPGLDFFENIFFLGFNHFLFYPLKAKSFARFYLRSGVEAKFLYGGSIEFKDAISATIIRDRDNNLSAQIGLTKSQVLKVKYSFPLSVANAFSATNSNEIILLLVFNEN